MLKNALGGYDHEGWDEPPSKANEALTVKIIELFDQRIGHPKTYCPAREAGLACGESRLPGLRRAAQIKSARGYKRPRYKVGKPELVAPNDQ